MALFSFGKKKANPAPDNPNAPIKILGTGCAKCDALEVVTKEALEELQLDDEVAHVRDLASIASYGVMSTPALVVDNKVVSYGRVLTKEEVIELIKKERE